MKKPNPEALLKASDFLCIEPKACFYVGDAVSDVFAAKNAGMNSIAVLLGMGKKE